jgi:hypothetical protein
VIGYPFKIGIKLLDKTTGESQVNIQDSFIHATVVKCPCCNDDMSFTVDTETFDHIHVNCEPCEGQTKVKVIYFHL